MNLTFFVILAICVFNGMASTLAIRIVFAILWNTWPLEFLPREPTWGLYQSSIIVSSATLLVSGIPAAIYERVTKPPPGDQISMYIWLFGAAVLSIPALQAVGMI